MTNRTWSDSDLIDAVSKSYCYRDICKKLFLNYHNIRSVKKRIMELNLDISHFNSRLNNKTERRKIILSTFLVEKCKNYSSSRLKQILIEENLLKNECYICNQLPIHNNLPLVLQLDHINGNHYDNRLENLRILCPNCHTQTETYVSKNRGVPKLAL